MLSSAVCHRSGLNACIKAKLWVWSNLKSRPVSLVCAALSIVFAVAPAAPARATDLELASAYAPENFHTKNLQQFADDVSRTTDGKLNIKVHPGGSLLKPTEIFAGVRDGRAQAGEVIMSSLAKDIPLFGMDALPFIVSDYDDARKMWDISRPAVEKALNARGLQLLYAVPWQPQNLYSRHAIEYSRDFTGQHMRSYNSTIERIAQDLGAIPVTIQAVDLPKAIADDKVDLMLTSSGTGVETKAWTKMAYYYKINAWIPKNIVFIDKKQFDTLDASTREKLVTAAREAEQRGWRLSQEADKSFESQLAGKRMSMAPLEPSIRRQMDRIGEKVARDWLKQAGRDELMVLLNYTTERAGRGRAKG